jgi:DNA-binding beta-propeller fold protein YncE
MRSKVSRVTAAIGIFYLAFFPDRLSSQREHSESFKAALTVAESGYTCMGETALQEGTGPISKGMLGGDVQPVRSVIDPFPTFNGIALNPFASKVLFSDENRKSILVYNRASGSASRLITQPVQQVLGPATGLGFVAGVAIDASHRDLYVVNNDIEDTVVVFSDDARGNEKPKRYLFVPHQSWGVALNESTDEMALSVQQLGTIAIYRRLAERLEAPVRIIKGPHTQMADPHGIYWDTAHNEIAVANHGNYSVIGAYGAYEALNVHPGQAPGGHFLLPSITVYSGSSKGDSNPIRVLQGEKTRLNWPMGIAFDALHNEIAVANNGDSSVLIFRRTESGDAAPVRVIQGNLTGVDAPVGVAIDTKNDELWVANYGDHTAVVFPRTATGNVAPKRIVRNAPAGTPTAGFTNPYAVAFDSKRDQILVPN